MSAILAVLFYAACLGMVVGIVNSAFGAWVYRKQHKDDQD